jgi:hypothetical protein
MASLQPCEEIEGSRSTLAKMVLHGFLGIQNMGRKLQ